MRGSNGNASNKAEESASTNGVGGGVEASGEGDMVQLFLDRGADVHLQCDGGSHPLHYAVMSGNKAACKLLLKAGARINATDYEGTTVSLLARSLQPQSADVMRRVCCVSLCVGDDSRFTGPRAAMRNARGCCCARARRQRRAISTTRRRSTTRPRRRTFARARPPRSSGCSLTRARSLSTRTTACKPPRSTLPPTRATYVSIPCRVCVCANQRVSIN